MERCTLISCNKNLLSAALKLQKDYEEKNERKSINNGVKLFIFLKLQKKLCIAKPWRIADANNADR
jgi:hypothetical protein